ncbi:MAG: hypothetical protein IJC78_07590 [Clostridia bacterium]|nr:hypothetical protein [Clostridia bacterium]
MRHRCYCRIWFPIAAALFCGILAGMIFPTVFLLITEAVLLLFLLFCWLCG